MHFFCILLQNEIIQTVAEQRTYVYKNKQKIEKYDRVKKKQIPIRSYKLLTTTTTTTKNWRILCCIVNTSSGSVKIGSTTIARNNNKKRRDEIFFPLLCELNRRRSCRHGLIFLVLTTSWCCVLKPKVLRPMTYHNVAFQNTQTRWTLWDFSMLF